MKQRSWMFKRWGELRRIMEENPGASKNSLAMMLMDRTNCTPGAAQACMNALKTIRRMEKLHPGIEEKILSGEVDAYQNELVRMTYRPDSELKELAEQLEENNSRPDIESDQEELALDGSDQKHSFWCPFSGTGCRENCMFRSGDSCKIEIALYMFMKGVVNFLKQDT